MTLEYGEFERLLIHYDPARIKKAVYAGMSRYLKNYTAADESRETVLRTLFEEQITPLTNQRKGATRSDEPYLGLLDSWRKGEGSFPLAKAAYYWLHVAPADKSYADIVDRRLEVSLNGRFAGIAAAEQSEPPPDSVPLPSISDLKDDAPDNVFRTINKIARNPSIFFPQIAGSGFELHDLIQAAEEELLICGQNLFSLVRVEDGAETLRIISAAVDRGVVIKMMICNPDETDHIEPWSFAVNSRLYGSDLLRSARILATWPSRFSNHDVQVKVAKFIPTSITFVDPLNKSTRFAIITPHHFTPVSTSRPFVLLTHHSDSELYDQYYHNYEYVWDHATAITSVSAIRD